MLEWWLLVTRTITYICAGAEAAFGIMGIAERDLSYLVPMLAVGAAAWAVVLVQFAFYRRSVRHLRRGWN